MLVPYIFIAAVWVAPIYIYFWGVDNVVSQYVLGTAPSQLWFLLMLFWVFAIYWPLSGLVNRHPTVGGVVVIACYAVGLFTPNYFCLSKGLQYIQFFYLGFIIRKLDLGNKIFYKVPCIVYLLIDILLFALTKIIGNEGLIVRLMSMGLGVLLHSFGAVSAFVILQKIYGKINTIKVLDFFVPYKMPVYLMHQQVIYFSIGWFNGVVTPVVLLVINFTFSLVVSTLFAWLMSKIRITRFLLGG